MALLQHPIIRKGKAFAMQPYAAVQRLKTTSEDYQNTPPIFANSLPKSGTHLLLQVTQALPTSQYLGRFIATSPSLTQKERSPAKLARKIRTILPGETLGSHLYYSKEAEAALEDINAVHLFIYRDPRDVISSEAFYLAEMNRWHRMHKHFHKCADNDARLALALDGLDDRYPECNARLLPYAGWLTSKQALCIRYEDMAGPNQAREIERIAAAHAAKRGHSGNLDDLVASLISAVQPEKSHTFRQGGSGKWRKGLDEATADHITERLRPSLDAFGYTA